MPHFNDTCYASPDKHCACIEFHLSEQPESGLPQRHGFHASQLIDYTLELNPDAKEDRDAPQQKFAIAFSTADVVVLGWRLDFLADKLMEGTLAALRILPKRYADFDRSKPFVASISITPIAKE